MKRHKVVITGIGLISAQGMSFYDFCNEDAPAEPNIKLKNDWNHDKVGPQYYYSIPDYDIKEYFEGLRAPFPLRYSQLAMLGCGDAMRDAGLEEGNFENSRAGIMIDTAFGASEAVEDYLTKLFNDGPRKVRPFKFSQTVSNVCLGYTARHFKLRGPSSLLFGETSLSYGYDLIKNGEADIMICGGVDSIRDYVFGLYHNEDALIEPKNKDAASPADLQNDLAEQQDKTRITVGEASAFVVLETLEHAEARQARIYAEILDYAVIQDSEYKTLIFERNADDCALSMQKALERSQVAPEEVDAVVGAAYSPNMSKEIDLPAIEQVWGDHELYYTSMKAHIGETFSSSTQASVGLAVQLLHRQKAKANPLASLYEVPDNISLSAESKPGYSTVVVHTEQLGGNNTSFVLKAV